MGRRTKAVNPATTIRTLRFTAAQDSLLAALQKKRELKSRPDLVVFLAVRDASVLLPDAPELARVRAEQDPQLSLLGVLGGLGAPDQAARPALLNQCVECGTIGATLPCSEGACGEAVCDLPSCEEKHARKHDAAGAQLASLPPPVCLVCGRGAPLRCGTCGGALCLQDGCFSPHLKEHAEGGILDELRAREPRPGALCLVCGQDAQVQCTTCGGPICGLLACNVAHADKHVVPDLSFEGAAPPEPSPPAVKHPRRPAGAPRSSKHGPRRGKPPSRPGKRPSRPAHAPTAGRPNAQPKAAAPKLAAPAPKAARRERR